MIFFKESSSHLLSHIVSNIVPSAAYVLTFVFGMRTGVPRKRIATGYFFVVLYALHMDSLDNMICSRQINSNPTPTSSLERR